MFYPIKISRMFILSIFSVSILGCQTLPSSGPSARHVKSSVNTIDESFKPVVVDIDQVVTDRLQSLQQQSLFSEIWGGDSYQGTVGLGDVLDVSIWEAPPAVLFGGSLGTLGAGEAQLTKLQAQMVDANGVITIPFAGRVKVVGRSPRQIENDITQRLKEMANQPQVVVSIAKNNSANVTVIREGSSLNIPLTAKKERVLDALAAIGGVPHAANKTTLQLTRGKATRALPLIQIVQDPRQNVVLKPGDVITSIYQPYTFTVLGATGKNEEVNFESQGLTLAQALGRVGGLKDGQADAQGVFVFRYEQPNALSFMAREPSMNAQQKVPVVYRADLKNANTFFHAQNFQMHDRDILYVANAPASELQKFLNIVYSISSPIFNTARSIQLLQ